MNCLPHPFDPGYARGSVLSDQNADLEVTYAFSHEDYLHFIDFWVKRHRSAYLRRTVQVFSLFLAAYVVLFLLYHLPVGFALGLSAFLSAIGTSLVHRARRRRMRRVRERLLGERSTRIGPEGVWGRFPQFEILSFWKGVSEIAEDEGYLFFFTGGSRAHVVPKRAFATAVNMEQFREAANSYWKSSRSGTAGNAGA